MRRSNDIKDLYAGYEAFIAGLFSYHADKSQFLGLPFDDYIAEKVAIKARLFNSILNANEPTEAQKQAEQDKLAEQYRKQSDGE